MLDDFFLVGLSTWSVYACCFVVVFVVGRGEMVEIRDFCRFSALVLLFFSGEEELLSGLCFSLGRSFGGRGGDILSL